MFVKVESAWRSIMGTVGVSSLIMCGPERPGLVEDAVVEELRGREGPDGLVALPDSRGFSNGKRVRIEDGPLWGLDALYDGQSGAERCYVLISLMGRIVRAQVRERDLVAA